MRIKSKQVGLLYVVFFLFITLSLLSSLDSKASLDIPLVEEKNLTDSGSIKYQQYLGYYKPFEKYIDISIVDVNLNSPEVVVKPVISSSLETVQKFSLDNNALVAINGGYFDYSNGMSVSNVKIDGKIAAEPKYNKNLTQNPEIKPYLKDIFNRSELKVLSCEGKVAYAIDKNSKVYSGCRVYQPLGGGPKLLPSMDLEKEAFLVYKNGKKVRESANVTSQDARVALGLTSNNHMIFVIANAGFYKDSYYGLTIKELSKILKNFNADSALAYDGGSSTTMFVKMPDGKNKIIIGDVNNKGERIQAKVKTALIVTLRKKIEK